MKNILIILIALAFSSSAFAQGNSGKNKSKDNPSQQTSTSDKDKVKDKDKDKSKVDNKLSKNDEHDRKIWDGIGDGGCMKPSKNQPAKVRAAFQRDYPGAINVRWTKCRGDWTATFNGLIFRSTAVYHANGDRRDTRTPIMRDHLPRRILDVILKRFPGSPIEGGIKIEVPNVVKDIFRIKNIIDGKPQFNYYDADGVEVRYDY